MVGKGGQPDRRMDGRQENRTDKPTEVGPEVQMQDVSASSDPPVDRINDGGGSESTPESQEKKRRQEERAETERKKLKVEEKEKQAADLKKERSRDKEEKKKEKVEVEEVARKGEKRSGEDAGVDGREDDDGKYQNASSSAAEAPI